MATEEKSESDSAAPQPSLLQTIQGLWRELPGLVSDRVDLLALEMQRAGRALLQIVALAVVAAILAVTAWLALWGVALGLLMVIGMHWSVALLLVLAVNLSAAWWAVARMRSLVPNLRLPATRRHLTLTPSPLPGQHPPAAPPDAVPERAQPVPTYANNPSHAAAR